jgi:hypothetical protein
MQLSQLSLADPLAMNWHSKRSILQLHVLFLGLLIEPYRKSLVNLGRYRLSNISAALEDLKVLKNLEEQCVLAARQSARVASLLQTNNLIRPHCWVSMYVDLDRNCCMRSNARNRLKVYQFHWLRSTSVWRITKTTSALWRGSQSGPHVRIFTFERPLSVQLRKRYCERTVHHTPDSLQRYQRDCGLTSLS